MRAFKYMLAGILFACAIAQPAVAGALTQADIDFVFDPAAGYTVDSLIPLSPEEMDQIEGRYWVGRWRQIARAIQGFYHSIQRGVTFSVGRFTYKIKYDEAPHNFGPAWGALKGNRPHWQVTRWATGVDKSHRKFRFPWGKVTPPGSIPKGSRGGRKKGEPRAPRSPDSSGSPDSLSAGDDTRTPSDQLIQLVQQEMPGGSGTSSDSGEPTSLTESESEAPAYTGPMPTERLRALIFQYTEPTRAEACRWVGGLNC